MHMGCLLLNNLLKCVKKNAISSQHLDLYMILFCYYSKCHVQNYLKLLARWDPGVTIFVYAKAIFWVLILDSKVDITGLNLNP